MVPCQEGPPYHSTADLTGSLLHFVNYAVPLISDNMNPRMYQPTAPYHF